LILRTKVNVNAGSKRKFLISKKKLIKVPSCWEEYEEDYEGVAWYGRTFKVPSTWKGKVVMLRFGAVNYLAEVWWGTDLGILSYGRGKIILSTLRLIENLGKEPVADRILYNMVTFVASISSKPSEIIEEELKSELKKYMKRF